MTTANTQLHQTDDSQLQSHQYDLPILEKDNDFSLDNIGGDNPKKSIFSYHRRDDMENDEDYCVQTSALKNRLREREEFEMIEKQITDLKQVR